METIFDYDPTTEELKYLADPDAAAYRARVTEDEALEALSMLFAMRGDGERSVAYARRMSDQDYVRFNLLNHDLMPATSAKNRVSPGTLKASKAA